MVHRAGEAAEQRGRRQHPLTRPAPGLRCSPCSAPGSVPRCAGGACASLELPPRGLGLCHPGVWLPACSSCLARVPTLPSLPPRSGTFVPPRPGPRAAPVPRGGGWWAEPPSALQLQPRVGWDQGLIPAWPRTPQPPGRPLRPAFPRGAAALVPLSQPWLPSSQNKGFCVAGRLPQLLPWWDRGWEGDKDVPRGDSSPAGLPSLLWAWREFWGWFVGCSQAGGAPSSSCRRSLTPGGRGARSQSATFRRTPEQGAPFPWEHRGLFPTACGPWSQDPAELEPGESPAKCQGMAASPLAGQDGSPPAPLWPQGICSV